MIRLKLRASQLHLIKALNNEKLVSFSKFSNYGNNLIKMMLTEHGLFDARIITDDCSIDVYRGGVPKAIFNDDLEELSNFLATNKCPNKIDVSKAALSDLAVKEYSSMLEACALFGSSKCFKHFLMNGEAINAKLSRFAIAGGNAEIIHILEQDGNVFKNCLIVSVMYHRHELFEWLNMHFECESISLQKCIYYLNEAAALFFVEQGSDVNFIDEISPLHCALNEGLSGAVEFLLRKGANVNEKEDSWFPLKQAVEDASYEEVSLLINSGANVNEDDERGRTSLITAVNDGYFNIVKLLVEHGADVNKCDETKKSPLFKALRWGRFEISKYLIESGAVINMKDDEGNTPLHEAAISKNALLIDLLIDNGADVNAQNDELETPLHLAVHRKQVQHVKKLVNKGADLNKEDANGETPLQIAEDEEYQEIINILKQ